MLESLKNIITTIKWSLLPAFLLLVGLCLYYMNTPYITELNNSVHITFFIITLLLLISMGIFNKFKPFYIALLTLISYITINYLKYKYNMEYLYSYEYQLLCALLPLNILFIYFIKQKLLFNNFSQYILIFIFSQISLSQHFGNIINRIPYIEINLNDISAYSMLIWISSLTTILIDVSRNETIEKYGIFYSTISIFLGLIYSSIPSGISTFYTTSSLILLCTSLLYIYHKYYHDSLNNVDSYNSYISHETSKLQDRLPFKYTVGIFSIDNRDKLEKVIGTNNLFKLEQMIVDCIYEFPHNISIYRYETTPELMIIFKNEIIKHAKEYAENIRHKIAASEFILSNNKKIKITISICLSEKTRLDYANNVAQRAHQGLQKAYRFNCNIVTVC